MRLLHIDSSISGDASVSRQLTAAVVSEWQRRVPGLNIRHRDLVADPLPHLDGAGTPDSEILKSVAVLDEFLAADVVVIGAPMYNLAIPSQLKAWLDRIVVAGKTFKYTATGPQGLAADKKVIVVSSRGGLYAPGTQQAATDFQETHLRAIFGFIGISDVEVIRAEGVALGLNERAASIEAALALVGNVVDSFVAADAA